MKKIILLSCVLFLTSAAFAQVPSFNLGLKAGVNLASLKTDFASESNRLGYQFGAWARVGGASVYLQPEAYLAGKNNEIKFSTTSQPLETDAKVKFTTLDVPLLLGTKVGSNRLNLRFMAGPVISFIVDKKTTFESASSQVTDFNDYKNQTWGGQAGAGVDIGGLSIDLRYEAGLSNISNSGQYDQKQNLWHLSLGFKIL